MTPPVVVTVAGSDSCGGAGVQADLATFAAHGVLGATAVTAVTVQDTTAVHAVHPVPTEVVVAQVEAVVADLALAAAKTGMLATAATVAAVADLAAAGLLPHLVVDPVLVASSGDLLLERDAVALLRDRLLPHCRVVTPNRAEAAALLGRPVQDLDDARAAAVSLAARGPDAVVVTGGRAAVDVVWVAGELVEVRAPSVATRNDHGTGCAHSAALAAGLAHGLEPLAAARHASAYVHEALRGAAGWRVGAGRGPLDHLRQEAP